MPSLVLREEGSDFLELSAFEPTFEANLLFGGGVPSLVLGEEGLDFSMGFLDKGSCEDEDKDLRELCALEDEGGRAFCEKGLGASAAKAGTSKRKRIIIFLKKRIFYNHHKREISIFWKKTSKIHLLI